MTGRGRKLRVAQIGAGFFARFHAEAWARHPGAELVALCDLNEAAARALAGQAGDPPVFTEAEAMLRGVEADLVDIATPPKSHFGLIDLASARGLPLICQKAFCTSLAEAERAVALVRKRGSLAVVHENFRFQPWYRRAKAALESGSLGEIYQATFRLRPGDGQGPRAYLDRQPYFQSMPRFLLHETGIHLIDTFRFLLGEVTEVFADLRRLNPAIRGEDSGFLILRFGDGPRALFDGNRLSDHAARNRRLTMGELLIEGSAAELRLDGFGRLFLRRQGENEAEEIRYPWQDRGFGGDCVFALQAHVVRHLLEGGPLENSAEAYLANLRIEEAAYRSADLGHWVPVDF